MVTDRKLNVPYMRRHSFIKVLMLPTKAVDKGWSWVVCVACFVTTFTSIGILASFAVLYIGLLEFYDGSSRTDSCSTTNSSSIGGQTGKNVDLSRKTESRAGSRGGLRGLQSPLFE